jgi:hypothetical protein
MATDRARSQQEIFTAMHREMRAFNSQLPESPERLDPILKTILQLHAGQLARIDSRVDRLWDVATLALLRSLYPECKRWPVPAYTVMHCRPADPVIEIDPHTRFYYKEAREGGQTYFFSALRSERLVDAEVKHAFLKVGDTLVDLRPGSDPSAIRPEMGELRFSETDHGRVYLAVEHEDRPINFADARVFLKGEEEVLKQMRWARWYPSAASGRFYEDGGFCPGLTTRLDDLVRADGKGFFDWGGFRSDSHIFARLEDSFVILPESFAATWEISPPPPELGELIEEAEIPLANDTGHFYWVRIDLPKGGGKGKLGTPLEAFFGAFVVTNKNEQTLFKHTGGNRLIEIELPESIDGILDIVSVIDSSGRSYFPRHLPSDDPGAGTYALEERENRLLIWFDFSDTMESPPDAITVTYATTAGVAANGIGPGKIADLYESHPGVEVAANLIPTAGAIPAKTTQQIVEEVSSRLRNRDRALSFSEVAHWATGFDPRIKKAECRNGVERGRRGVRRCLVTAITLAAADFHSEDELSLLQTRLAAFLKSRAPVNTRFQVEIVLI